MRRAAMSAVVVFVAWAVLVAVAPVAPPSSTDSWAAGNENLLGDLQDLLAQLGPSVAAAQSGCSGQEFAAIDDAQDSYEAICGEPYNPSSGFHSCAWVTAGWVCSGPDSSGNNNGGGTTDPPDPDTGGPTGNGPLLPTNLTTVPVIGDTEAVNPDGIRVSWTPGGGPESIGFNINRRDVDSGQEFEYLISIIDRTWFVDCEVEQGHTYEYTVSAWSEGPEFSFTTLPQMATASITPPECRSLVPPGPSGENEPSDDPLFTSVTRDLNARPATPEQVRIVGSGANQRLRWEMPTSPRMVFQITRNGLTENVSDELWGQFQVTPGHQDMTFGPRGDGGSWMEFPVGQFAPGDNFVLQATHPWSIAEEELGPNARFSMSSRFATIINPGPGNTIPSFYDVLGTSQEPEGAWIGSRSDWSSVPQFTDNFTGSGELAASTNQWYFARNDGPREITPSLDREQTQTDDRAILNNGKLEMSARIADSTYSYIGTAHDNGDGYLIDPTNGVFVEASVRLDHMSPADNAWWAFWLMAPGSSGCDNNGDPVPGGSNAYDGHTSTGVELDLFEFVPDLNNGFNTALFRYEYGQAQGCPGPDVTKLAPDNRNFTYEGVQSLPNVTMPNYMDGNYHRLGLYYAQDCYVVYLDGEMMWQITEESHPGWITSRPREAIRLTWEIQNADPNNPWTERGGNFSQTALDRDPTVFIDFVNVWEKEEAANGLCSGGVDPEPEEPEEPLPELAAPVNLSAEATAGTIALTWDAGSTDTPDGYDIRRDGQGYWTVNEASFDDTQVVGEQSYTYSVVPWIAGADGTPESRTYGPPSETVTVTAIAGLGLPGDVTAVVDGLSVNLSWTAATGDVAGYRVFRNGVVARTVVGGATTVTDHSPVLGENAYTMRAFSEAVDGQRLWSGFTEPVVVSVFEPVSVPADFAAELVDAGVQLSWAESSGPVELYQLFRDQVLLRNLPADALEFVDDAPVVGATHEYRVRALTARRGAENLRSYSAWSPARSVTITAGLGVPGDVTAVVDGSTVALSWTAASGEVAGYRVFRNGVVARTVVGGATTVTDYSPVEGENSYTMRAFSAAADGQRVWSAFTDPVVVTVGGELDSVSVPSDVQAQVVATGVRLSWGESTGPVELYQVFRDRVFLRNVSAATLTFVDAAAEVGQSYEYRVRALTARQGPENLRTYSAWSPILSVTVTAVDGPGVPTDVVAVVNGPSVELSWTAATGDVAGYRVFRNGVVAKTVVDGGTNVVDDNPVTGENSYTLRAFTEATNGQREWGAFTDPVVVTVDEVLEPVSVPPNVELVLDGSTVRLSWQPSTGPVEAYQVFRDGVRVGNFVGLSFADDTAVPGATHSYQVRAFTANRGPANVRSFSAKSDPLSIDVPPAPEPEEETGPQAIENLTFTVSGNTLSLLWTEPSPNVDGYLFFRDNVFHDHKDAEALFVVPQLISQTGQEVVVWSDFATNGATAPHVYGIQPFMERPDGSRLLGTLTSIYTTPDTRNGSSLFDPVSDFQLETPAFEATELGGLQFSFAPPTDVEITGYIVEENGEQYADIPAAEMEVLEEGRLGFTIPNEGARPRIGSRDFAVRAYVDQEGTRYYSYRRVLSTHVAGNGFVTLLDTPILAPVEDLVAVQTRFKPEIVVKWKPQDYATLNLDVQRPSGYNIERNGEFLSSVVSSPYYDESVVAGQSYWYRVVPYFTSVNGDVEFGPPAATTNLDVQGVPNVISPDAPLGVSAEQIDGLGRRVEITWIAPEGWEQGLISYYQVMRNGQEYGLPVQEPIFGPDRFPYASRSFIDESALTNVPTSYTVVAFSTEGAASDGARSDVAFITPVVLAGTSGYYDPSQAPTDMEVPDRYARAAEVVFNVDGNEARRLGAEFFALHDYLNRDVWNTNSRILLRSFNQSAIERGFADPLSAIDELNASKASAQTLLTAIATVSGSEDGHLLAIIPELFTPVGYENFVFLGGWRVEQDMTEDQQLAQIKRELENLQGALEYVDNSPNSETAWKRTRNASQLIIWNAFNVRNGRGGEKPDYSHDRWYTAVQTGVVPPCRSPWSGCRNSYYNTPAATLFYEATESERVEFYGVDQNAWEFVQPYIELALVAQENVHKVRSARFRSYIAAAITIVVAVITAGKGLTWGTMIFSAFGAYASTYLVTGSTSQAEKALYKSVVGSGIQALGAGIADQVSNGLRVPGADIATYGLLHALVAYIDDPDDPQKALEAFTGAVLEHYGTEYFGEDVWAKLAPFVDVAEGIVWSAVLNEDIDFDDIGEELRDLIFSAIGEEFGELVGTVLPPQWSPFADPIKDLARYSVVASGDEVAIRQYFFATTLPALGEVVGSQVTERLGKENLYARVAGELVEIGITYGTENYDEKAFERLLYGVVGDLVREGLNDNLGKLNTTGDPAVTWVIDGLAELAYIGIAFAYDPNERDAQLEQFKLDRLTDVLLALMPGCVDTNNAAVQDVATGLVEAAAGQDLDERDVTDLVINGIWAGQSIAETCGTPANGEPENPEANLLDFHQRVLDLEPHEIEMTAVADGDELTLSAYPHFKIKLETSVTLINGTMANILDRADANASWEVTDYRVVAVDDINSVVNDFIESSATCPTTTQGVAFWGGSGSSIGTANLPIGLRGPTTPLLAQFGCEGLADDFLAWLLNLSPTQIGAVGETGTDLVFANRTEPSGRQVISGTAAEHPGMRIDIVDNHRAVISMDLGGVIRYTDVDRVGLLRDGTGDVNGFFRSPHPHETFKEYALRLTPAEIANHLVHSTITINGETFDLVESPFIPDQRLRLSGPTPDGDIGTIEIGRGVDRQPVADLVTVTRENGVIAGFTHLDDTTLEDMAGPMGRLLLSLIPSIPTSSEEWNILWNQLVGCGTAVKQFFQGLWQVVSNPIDTLVALIKAIPGIIELFAYSPRLLGEQFFTDLIRAEDYAELLALEGDALGEAQWMGRLKCDLVLAIAGGSIIRFVSKAVVKAIPGDINAGRKADLIGGCVGSGNSFPPGTRVQMADGSLKSIEEIVAGDRVRTYNEGERRWGDNAVLAQWSAIHEEPMATVTLTDGSAVTATDDHLFWVDGQGRWVEADALQPGDFLLTPDGVVQVAAVETHPHQPVEVWELDTAVDDTFTVAAGPHALLVHNAPRCFQAPSGSTGTARTFRDLMPSGRVPGQDYFVNWWNELEIPELAYLIQNKTPGSIYSTIADRIRRGPDNEGGNHEWCMCAEMLQFKRWGVSMDQIQEFTTKTDEVNGTLPLATIDDLGLQRPPSGTDYVWGHSSSVYDGDAISKLFHDELREIIQTSTDKDHFVQRLPALADRFGIDRAEVRPPAGW